MFSKVVGLLKSSLIASEQVDSYSQLDFIGDVHAHYNELVGLLKKMDYEYSNGVWQHPQKKAVFVGDFVNRGPSTLKVLELVKSMVENNKGYALLGNHELNLIGYFTLRKNGSPIAKLTPTHQAQMEQIKYQFENEEELHILFYSDTHSGFIRTLFRSAIFSKIGIIFLLFSTQFSHGFTHHFDTVSTIN